MINTILNLLRADGYITINKTLIRNIGLTPATIFCELSSKYKYFHDKGQLKDGFFYCTIPELEKEIGLTRKEQDTGFNKLIALGLIEKKVMKSTNDGSPKRYIRITNNIDLLIKYLEDAETTGFVQKGHIESEQKDISIRPKGTPNKNNNIILNNNNKSVSQSNLENNTIHEDDTNIEELEKQIINNLGIPELKQVHKVDSKLIDEIVDNVLDMYYSNQVKVNDEFKPMLLVRRQINKLTQQHIVYIVDRIKNYTSKIKNKKSFIQTTIYNASLEFNADNVNGGNVIMNDE